MVTANSTIQVGQRFVRWVVISERAKSVRVPSVQCQCDCGVVRIVRIGRLLSGNSRSCGCLRNEEKTKHGRTTRAAGKPISEYEIWKAMWQRTTNQNHKDYADYGGRGIIVCEHWREFANFYADMGPRPSKAHTIERDKNEEGYSPGNCRWATRSEQNKNKRNTRLITAAGKTMHLAEWARELGCRHSTIRSRIASGWSEEQAVTTTVQKSPQ